MFVFLFCFDLVLRRRRRGCVTTRKPHQYWCVCDYEGTLKQFNNTFRTRAKSQINALKILPELQTPQGGTKERKEHPRSRNTPCLTQLPKETGQPAQLKRSSDKWQLNATRRTSQSSRKREITSLDLSCPMTSIAMFRKLAIKVALKVKKSREQLRAVVTQIVSNVVVVWLTSERLNALHCGLFGFWLCSGACRFTVGLHHLAPQSVQTPFSFLTSCQFHMHHRQGKLEDGPNVERKFCSCCEQAQGRTRTRKSDRDDMSPSNVSIPSCASLIRMCCQCSEQSQGRTRRLNGDDDFVWTLGTSCGISLSFGWPFVLYFERMK